MAKKQAEEIALEEIVRKMKEDERFPRLVGNKILKQHEKEIEETEKRVRKETTKKTIEWLEKEMDEWIKIAEKEPAETRYYFNMGAGRAIEKIIQKLKEELK